MPDVEAIEEAVRSLPPAARAEFRRWFTEFDSADWDRQIETDVLSGKLDALLRGAEQELENPPHRTP